MAFKVIEYVALRTSQAVGAIRLYLANKTRTWRGGQQSSGPITPAANASLSGQIALPVPTDFLGSARRHMQDALMLESANRKANSGQLLGFTAECGVKAVMVWLGYPSPRSFVAALRSAGESPIQPNWQYAVHYKALQDGVLKASQIRVKEITQEDYPWVDPLMEPLKNRIVVPCEVDDIFQIWATKKTIENLSSSISGVDVRLLAPHSKEGAQGVLRDLEDLGVVSRLLDDRVQMPDIYRIAFGLGRKGGVKPLK